MFRYIIYQKGGDTVKKTTVIKCKKISLLCFIIFLICACINIILGIINVCNSPGTSFPWYSPIILVGMYYVIPLIILLAMYIGFKIKESKMME